MNSTPGVYPNDGGKTLSFKNAISVSKLSDNSDSSSEDYSSSENRNNSSKNFLIKFYFRYEPK